MTRGASFVPGHFRLTDHGNAERMVALYGDQIRHCQERGKWLTWQQVRWDWDETGNISRLAKATIRSIYGEAARCKDEDLRKALAKHAHQSESIGRRDAMIRIAADEDSIPVRFSTLDANPWLLNCENGTIELRTGRLRPHDRADLITKSTRLPFRADARSELWDRVLHDATAGDAALMQYLQRVAGYSLIGLPNERAFFFLHGPAGTAKSTFVFALTAALGDYAVSASFDTFCVQSNTGGNRGDIVRLAGARLVSCVEIRRGARWDEALVKRVTGGDAINASAKYEGEVEFKPTFTLLFAANDAPVARDDDDGLWARMRRIPFTAIIPKERQDVMLKERLAEPEHTAAILAWAVEGCLQYQNGGLREPVPVLNSTEDYRAEQDQFGHFIEDCLIFEPDARITRKALRIAYEEWGKEVGSKHLLGAKQVAQRLRLRACRECMVRGSRQWLGVRLRGPGDDAEQTTARAPIQATLPGYEDDPDEREAIQREGS